MAMLLLAKVTENLDEGLMLIGLHQQQVFL